MIADNPTCPVCGDKHTRIALSRAVMPVMQNRVYRTRKRALATSRASFTLRVCRHCGFAFNSRFNPKLLQYDARYDNRVPSETFEEYYREIAGRLRKVHGLKDGLVVDIGCGKGHFLEVLCKSANKIDAIGIDPSLEKVGRVGRITWIRDTFRKGQLEREPSLVICRHVLEHIPSPLDFLKMVRDGLSAFDSVPCFFEVPDLQWIAKNNAFWDLCYEHCNYFTKESISYALELAGFKVVSVSTAFSGQYLWIEAKTDESRNAHEKSGSSPKSADRIMSFGAGEKKFVKSAQAKLRAIRKLKHEIAVWGMATKGVVFSMLVDPAGTLIKYHVDINQNKQGWYAPATGAKILAPEKMQSEKLPITVIVMNPNYVEEIWRMCKGFRNPPTLVSPDWKALERT